MTRDQRNSLYALTAAMRVLIGAQGGTPSVINTAHGEATRIADTCPEPQRTAIIDLIKTAEDANLRIGSRKDARTGMLNALLDSLDSIDKALEALPVDAETPPPPQPITVTPNGSFVGTVYQSGLGPPENPNGAIKWTAGTDMIYRLKAGATGMFSFTAGSGGVWCDVGREADLRDAQSQSGSSPELSVTVGDNIYVRFRGGEQTPVQGLTASMPR